ncbi:hypothetical protein SAMN05216464_102255 [Mucilaginibacter pineti]|uniref:Uncharacterized protein n=1 Tax=Mucilaginibacter pineti TaxID=1391627 RepID=A0A1G6WRA4_9SPHI|nr:contractile injection system tape measure protein [Mucilaginibacter pineti]SDD67747.1 hypothetical protein SAMN05216464_102255 [Mucilaginibacter pineti]
MATSNHIIHRVVFHIEIPRRSMAKKVQDEVSRHFEEVLLKQLNQLLDHIDFPGHVLIDKLNLDLGTATLENIHTGLPAILNKALQEVIYPQSIPDTDTAEISVLKLTEDQKAFRVFCHFLQTGSLPWYAVANSYWLQQEDEWLIPISKVMVDNIAAKRQLLDLINNTPIALSRLFMQFGQAFIKKLVAVLLGVAVDEVQQYIERTLKLILTMQQGEVLISADEVKASLLFFEKLLLTITLLTGKQDLAFMPPLQKWMVAIGDTVNYTTINPIQIAADLVRSAGITQTSSSGELPKISPSGVDEAFGLDKPSKINKSAKQETPGEDDTQGIYVGQAGLVILHPFLEYFFKDFGLLQNNDFVDEPARQLAANLLHYLATGNTNSFEHDLQFEKFLCNWPLSKPIDRLLTIPDGMLTEADGMLRTVIKYWKSLKNTSPDGLREAFLQRSGKLLEQENPARIIIEKKDMDILLGTLPWGLGVIKLPWISEPFYVEWA